MFLSHSSVGFAGFSVEVALTPLHSGSAGLPGVSLFGGRSRNRAAVVLPALSALREEGGQSGENAKEQVLILMLTEELGRGDYP